MRTIVRKLNHILQTLFLFENRSWEASPDTSPSIDMYGISSYAWTRATSEPFNRSSASTDECRSRRRKLQETAESKKLLLPRENLMFYSEIAFESEFQAVAPSRIARNFATFRQGRLAKFDFGSKRNFSVSQYPSLRSRFLFRFVESLTSKIPFSEGD